MEGAVTVVVLFAVSVSLTARVNVSPCTTFGKVIAAGSIVKLAALLEILP